MEDRIRRGTLLAATLFFFGCGDAASAPARGPADQEPVAVDFEDPGQQVRDFMDTEDILLSQADYAGFTALMAPDVVWLGPGAGRFAAGRPAAVAQIRALFENPDSGDSRVSFRTPFEVVGVAPDHGAAWVAEEMPGEAPGPDGTPLVVPYRVTSFVVRSGNRWQVAAQLWSVGTEGEVPASSATDPLPGAIGPGAQPLVDALDAVLADPAALEAAVSPRTDVFVFGAALEDAAAGGARARQWLNAKATTDAVRFSRGGPAHAALSPGGTAGFVACDVDVSALEDGRRVSRLQRGLFIWLAEGDAWQLVQIHLSHLAAD